MLSEETVGEHSEQAHRQRIRNHVILSGAKDLRAAHRGLPLAARWLRDLLGAREASLAAGARIDLPQMLRTHRAGLSASVLPMDGLGGRRADPSLHSG